MGCEISRVVSYIAGLRCCMSDRQPWIGCGTMLLFNPLLLTPHLATSYG